jgi:hypothetical protein
MYVPSPTPPQEAPYPGRRAVLHHAAELGTQSRRLRVLFGLGLRSLWGLCLRHLCLRCCLVRSLLHDPEPGPHGPYPGVVGRLPARHADVV